MYPHRIRLRDPWESSPGEGGGVRFRRRFGYPGRIDAHERIWLTFVGFSAPVAVTLNGGLLTGRDGTASAFEYEVTSLLRPRNELIVDVDGATAFGEVALEVRCTAYLRGLRCRALPGAGGHLLQVRGEVVGVAERPLELYIVLNRSVAAYEVVTAAPEGRPFDIRIAVPPTPEGERPGAPSVKVELVNGATVWYGSEQQAALDPSKGPGE